MVRKNSIFKYNFVKYFLVSATAFYKRQRVLDFVHEVLDLDNDVIRRPLSDSQRLRFAKEIKGKEEREREEWGGGGGRDRMERIDIIF